MENRSITVTPKDADSIVGVAGLSLGVKYKVESVNYGQGFVVIKNDNAFLRTYALDRFSISK